MATQKLYNVVVIGSYRKVIDIYAVTKEEAERVAIEKAKDIVDGYAHGSNCMEFKIESSIFVLDT